MPRLFVALVPPPTVRVRLGELQRAFDEVRWTPSEQLHLTVRFLGDVPSSRLRSVQESVSALVCPSFDVELREPIALPSPHEARVLAVAARHTIPLDDLYRASEAVVLAAKGDPDGQSFLPHVTVGRLRTRANAESWLLAHRTWHVRWKAEHVHLMRSELGPNGAVYTVERTVRLHE